MAGLEQNYRDLNQMSLDCFFLIKNTAFCRFLEQAKKIVWDLASFARSRLVRLVKSKTLRHLYFLLLKISKDLQFWDPQEENLT